MSCKTPTNAKDNRKFCKESCSEYIQCPDLQEYVRDEIHEKHLTAFKLSTDHIGRPDSERAVRRFDTVEEQKERDYQEWKSRQYRRNKDSHPGR